MAVKIRLARKGKKKKPYYHIVVADARAPRDGKFIERIGNYNPNVNPAAIELDEDKALEWLQKGAQPTETARAILSYEGLLLKKHLAEGVAKGALTEADAEKKHKAWLADHEKKIGAKTDKIKKGKDDKARLALSAEKEAQEAKAKDIAAKNSALVAEAERASGEQEKAKEGEESTEEVQEEVTDVAAVGETTEEPAKDEAPADVKEDDSDKEVSAEEEAPAKDTAPVEEAPSEETAKEEEAAPEAKAKTEESPVDEAAPAEEEAAPEAKAKTEESPVDEAAPAQEEEAPAEGENSDKEGEAEEAPAEEDVANEESSNKDEEAKEDDESKKEN